MAPDTSNSKFQIFIYSNGFWTGDPRKGFWCGKDLGPVLVNITATNENDNNKEDTQKDQNKANEESKVSDKKKEELPATVTEKKKSPTKAVTEKLEEVKEEKKTEAPAEEEAPEQPAEEEQSKDSTTETGPPVFRH